jgi:uncharacterized membrane protein HdeD (DUF308 family)
MTDPRINPAGSPGNEGGASPPRAGGRHGLFHHSSGSDQAESGASSVGTATRTTTAAGATVPPQTGQAPSGQTASGPTRATAGYGRPAMDDDTNMLARAANMSWIALALGAVAMIAVGVMLLVWPHASLTIVAILIGAALVASGLVRLYEGFTAKGGESGGMRAAYIVIGLLAVIAGLYCLRHHSLSIFLVAFVAGLYFVLHGVADVGAGLSSRGGGRGLRVILGLFSIAAGLILVVWPSITLVLLLTIMGAWLLFYGVVLGALAFSVRRAAKAVTRPTTSATMAKPARAA